MSWSAAGVDHVPPGWAGSEASCWMRPLNADGGLAVFVSVFHLAHSPPK
jgi:hypothetical protein